MASMRPGSPLESDDHDLGRDVRDRVLATAPEDGGPAPIFNMDRFGGAPRGAACPSGLS